MVLPTIQVIMSVKKVCLHGLLTLKIEMMGWDNSMLNQKIFRKFKVNQNFINNRRHEVLSDSG